jgi:hypothetical protein
MQVCFYWASTANHSNQSNPSNKANKANPPDKAIKETSQIMRCMAQLKDKNKKRLDGIQLVNAMPKHDMSFFI